ncbi:hypothetical protein [Herbaspirillum autotrophicum]|uniref:hypothetical protein n=1 Tax=Herbaspirillum autotrophicum TaxID=180195 RepID=UPI00067A9F6D|nr:hypothetical protein [Herbaspirillum autotrophicum]
MEKTYEDRKSEIEWMGAALHYQEGGDPDELAGLLRSDKPIPPIARAFLARIVLGDVKLSDRRGKSNSKVTRKDREQIRAGLENVYVETQTVLIFANELADEIGVEVIDIRQKMEKFRRNAVKQLADHFSISENTIRQYHDANRSINLAWCLAGKNDFEFDGKVIPGLFGEPKQLAESALKTARGYLEHPELFFNPLTE